MSRFRIDYKTLVAAVGVIVSLAVLFTVLDSMDARSDAARSLEAKDRQIESRDQALLKAQEAASDAAAQSRVNGEQIEALIAQVAKQTEASKQQDGVVSALRNVLAENGISTVVKDGKVAVVKGPVERASARSQTSRRPPSTAANPKPPVSGGPGKAPGGAPPSPGTAAPAPSTPTPTPSAPSGTIDLELPGEIIPDDLCILLLVCVR